MKIMANKVICFTNVSKITKKLQSAYFSTLTSFSMAKPIGFRL